VGIRSKHLEVGGSEMIALASSEGVEGHDPLRRLDANVLVERIYAQRIWAESDKIWEHDLFGLLCVGRRDVVGHCDLLEVLSP
jgi:hypothetical protein